MDKDILNISDELLDNLSIEQLAELKVEIDDLLMKADNIIENCEAVLNS